jgi:hypothetical protein
LKNLAVVLISSSPLLSSLPPLSTSHTATYLTPGPLWHVKEFSRPDIKGGSPAGAGWIMEGWITRWSAPIWAGRGKGKKQKEMGHCPKLAGASAVPKLLFWQKSLLSTTSDLHDPVIPNSNKVRQ